MRGNKASTGSTGSPSGSTTGAAAVDLPPGWAVDEPVESTEAEPATGVDPLQAEIQRTQESLRAWQERLKETREVMQRAQVQAAQAERQIALHQGRLEGLRWRLCNPAG